MALYYICCAENSASFIMLFLASQGEFMRYFCASNSYLIGGKVKPSLQAVKQGAVAKLVKPTAIRPIVTTSTFRAVACRSN